MTSSAQIAANRRNALRSTGPRTSAGKERVARNAVRHGLASRIVAGTPPAARVTQLVDAIIGDGAHTAEIEGAARIAAEAQYTIERVRLQRSVLIDRTAPEDRPYQRPSLLKAVAKARRAIESADEELLGPLKGYNLRTIARIENAEPLWRSATESDQQALVFQQFVRLLQKLDRYERRAMSRRNAALVEIEALKAEAGSSLIVVR
jgi:hypothetical protein